MPALGWTQSRLLKKDQNYDNIPADGVDGLGKCTKKTRNQPGIAEFLHELNDETFAKYDCVTIGEAPGVPYEQYGDYIGDNGYFSMIFLILDMRILM
ncbi:hypothetical protein GCM10020331_061940 [Ectobacillus funiculus]